MGDAFGIDYRDIVTVNHATQEYVTLVSSEAPQFAETMPDDGEYGRALDTLVVACVDLLIVDGADNVLLGRRQRKPQADLWLLGGRMRAGLPYRTSAVRNAHRELGVQLNLDCLTPREIGHYSLVWDEREQAPQDRGCHTISHVFGYQAGNNEFSRHNGEYSELVWVPKQKILQDDGRRYHPLLSQVIEDFRMYVILQEVHDRRLRS
jgi:ADP-ribose pyrophosphatase YjhB (NUDIX family)